ncbi:MAG: Flp pilus assembly protein CpaB [Thermoleophilaceae bacterium]
MSKGARRRRALLLLSLALACGGLAASEVGGRVREVEGRVGRPAPVVAAAHELKAGKKIRRGDLVVREVPARFAPPDALAAVAEAVGATPSAPLTRGAYLTAASLGGGQADSSRPGVLRRGERAVEIDVAGGSPLSGSGGPGSRVDVVVSTEPRNGSGRTFLALENVELLGLGGSGGGGASPAGAGAGGADEGAGAAGRASATATLRVTLRQAVYLTAAENFAREVRLMPRPGGDRRHAGRSAVSAEGL